MLSAKRPLRFANTIFLKMLAGYIALTLLIVALTGVVSFFLLERYILLSNQQDLLEKAQTIASMAATQNGRARTLSVPRLYEYEDLCDAQLIYVTTDMRARWLPPRRNPEGDEADESFQMSDVIGAMDVELFRSILGGTPATDVRRLEFINKDAVFAGAPILNESGTVEGAFILYRPVTDVSGAVNSLLSLEVLAGASALLFAIAMAWLISRYLTRPLSKLNKAAQRVAEGEYGERVDVHQRDEIGQLGDTLNLLSGRLKSVIGSLKDEKNKLEQILASIGEGLVAVDAHGQITHINPPALKLLSLADADESSEHKSALLKSLLDAVKRAAPTKEVWTSADKQTVEAMSAPIIGEIGVPIGAVALLRDISEPMRLEQMRRDYIANISHELRTPLTGIRGMVEPLIDGLMETAQERMDCYAIIYQETLRLERLIGEMLDLSRLQEGRIELDMEQMEPEGLIEAAMRRIMPRAAEAGIEVAFEPPDEVFSVIGNENRIIQVLTIFLDNALSFTQAGGKVALFVRRDGDKAVFGVRDTGAGIDPEDLPYIWERFYKADKARMGTSGTGLGLAIAKLIVETMHGEIGVKSAPGEGATFTFALDIAK